jgi:sialate O-acetylesterase
MQNLLLFILFTPFLATAQLRVAKIFSDNMVLQRDAPLHIWGKGIPKEKVSVSVSQFKNTTQVKADSTWSIVLIKQKAAALSKTITIISGREKVELKNVLFGDLWVCIGQSNMEKMCSEVLFQIRLCSG